MDPLSDVLSLLKPKSYACGGVDVGGDFAVKFGRYDGIKCYAVVTGRRWLCVDGVSEPVRLVEGDCFLLPTGRPFCLTSDLSLTPIDHCGMAPGKKNGGIFKINGGGDCLTVGGHFLLSGSHSSILLGMLPPIVHLREESDRFAMRWALERMMEELREPRPGGVLVTQQLAYTMLIQALRQHVEQANDGVGWLFALGDKQLSKAFAAMHGNPGRRWKLQELAEEACMSRSTFAEKFKGAVGESAMEYLTRWRMLLAGEQLTNSDDSVSAIALDLGYESESAFSMAFKRVMGCSPRQYGRRALEKAGAYTA